ncbi:Hypp6487 [Branchiostoma lanceolatum]|uniref:Hypp6487 protein n=1 Tax=Branchiostoma lanceolatum TaxID=7740 RepID=A0A8J9YV00_BRALA|nr:Hypp6487 [Branchiostoma lanceolatum]
MWRLSCSMSGSGSPKRTAAFVKSQLTIKGMMGAKSPSAQQSVCRKLKRACHTRWLSFDQAVKTVYAYFWAILQTLSAFESCPVATGLLKKMKCSRFLGIIIILENVPPHLAELSKSFQASTLNFSRVSPAITKAKDELREIARSNIVRNQLRVDLNPKDGQFRHTDIKLTETVEVQVAKLAQTYTDALCVPDLPNPESETGRFRSYGSEEIDVLADHFFESSEEKQHQLTAEWSKFKYDMHANLKPQLPKDPVTQTPTVVSGKVVNNPEACTMLTHAVETWFSANKRHGSKRLAEERRQQERMQKALIKLRQLYGKEEADVTMADPDYLRLKKV